MSYFKDPMAKQLCGGMHLPKGLCWVGSSSAWDAFGENSAWADRGDRSL